MKRLSIFLFLTLCLATSAAGQTCTPSPTVACLLDDRFQLQVAWTDVPGNPLTLPSWGLAGDGVVSLVPTEERPRTALFSFFTPDTPTMIVKMIDVGGVIGGFWLFGSASTNVAFTLTVTDTLTGQIESYANPQGTIASAIFDTDSFSALPSSSTGSGSATAGAPVWPRLAPLSAASHGVLPCDEPCEPPPCEAPVESLQDGRFEIELCFFNQFADNRGVGTPVVFSETTGLFWFFRPDNIELVVNVIDGRGANEHFWVHVASLTAVNWTLTIRDTRTGAVWSRTNPPGEIDPVLDQEAFDDLSDVPTLSQWGLGLLVLLLLGCGWGRLRSLRHLQE